MARKPDNIFRFRRLKWGEPKRFDAAPKSAPEANPARGPSALDIGLWALIGMLVVGAGYLLMGSA